MGSNAFCAFLGRYRNIIVDEMRLMDICRHAYNIICNMCTTQLHYAPCSVHMYAEAYVYCVSTKVASNARSAT